MVSLESFTLRFHLSQYIVVWKHQAFRFLMLAVRSDEEQTQKWTNAVKGWTSCRPDADVVADDEDLGPRGWAEGDMPLGIVHWQQSSQQPDDNIVADIVDSDPSAHFLAGLDAASDDPVRRVIACTRAAADKSSNAGELEHGLAPDK
jgi:hypothetical protein